MAKKDKDTASPSPKKAGDGIDRRRPQAPPDTNGTKADGTKENTQGTGNEVIIDIDW